MSEPVRQQSKLPSLPPLPPNVEALLARERPSVDRMPEAPRGRVWAKVQAGAPLPRAGAGHVRHGLGRTLLTFAVGAAVGSGATLALRPERTVPPPSEVSSRGVGSANTPGSPNVLRDAQQPVRPPLPSASPTPAPGAPKPKRRASAHPPVAQPLPSPAPGRLTGDASLAAERTLVDTARTALTRAEPARALEALDAHARQFPEGTLAEEREALRVQAFLAQGDADSAGDAVARFARKYPKSLLLPALRASLAAGAEKGGDDDP